VALIFITLYRDMFLKHTLLEIEIHGDGFSIARLAQKRKQQKRRVE
jgi:hypothetical protein